MPIPTSSDPWQTAERSPNTRDRLHTFLQEHPDQAFHVYELADEATEAGWERFFEKERLIQSVGEEEYYENRERYEDQLPDGPEGGGVGIAELRYVQKCLMDLEDDGKVEVRHVSVSDLAVPMKEWDTVDCYAHTGELGSS